MILKNSFFKILSYCAESQTFELNLDAEHEIYQAHFPGHPITPGVCIVQIAKELMEELTKKELAIDTVKNVKFLSILSPAEHPKVDYTFSKLTEKDGEYAAQINVHCQEASFVKLSLTCKSVQNPSPLPDVKQTPGTKQTLHDRGICVVIPTYNNGGTIKQVVEDVLLQADDVIVVNDGSTDNTAELLGSIEGITRVDLPKNSGKGHALRAGFRKAREMGFAYAITLDGDGQHYAKDIPAFLKANQQYPGSLIVGERDTEGVERTTGSGFANKFSNFWFTVQTGCRLKDTQTGYRLYPLRKLAGLSILPARYEAELMLMVLASWHGVKLTTIPIDVYYPPKEERVSHFRPVKDFVRISLLNTLLCILAVVYALPVKCIRLLLQILRSAYSLIAFTIISVVIVTPLTWVYVKIGKMTEKKRLHIHQIIYYFARFVMMIHGIPGTKFSYRVDPEVDFSKPQLVICNHQSHLDLMCQLLFTPKIVFLTNDWVWNNPFYGFLIRNAEYLPVSQGIDVLLPQLKDLVKRGYSIAVFPEGTRSADCRIGRFHQGAFFLADQLHLDLLPMTLYGTGIVLPKKGRRLHKGHIYIDVQKPFSQEQLSGFEDDMAKASYFRDYYKKKFNEIKNKFDQYA